MSISKISTTLLLVIALLSSCQLVGRVTAGPGKNFVCRGENFLGSNCDSTKCQSQPGTYPGLHCACKPCPTKVGNSAFDQKMYFCLTSHFKACPEVQEPTISTERLIINKDRSSQQQEQQGSTTDATTPRRDNKPEFAGQQRSDNGETMTAKTTAGVKLPIEPPLRTAAQWAGLALGLAILIVGAAALIGWFFWDKERLDEKKKKTGSRDSDELLKGAERREAGAAAAAGGADQTGTDNGQPQEDRRMFNPPEAAPDE